MSEKEMEKDGSLCADEEEELSCKNPAEVECVKCEKVFCYSHVVYFESWMQDSGMEEGQYCRECVTSEMTRLDEEYSRMKGYVKDLERELKQIKMLPSFDGVSTGDVSTRVSGNRAQRRAQKRRK